MTNIHDLLRKHGIHSAVISIALTELVPIYRVALSKNGADCDGMHGSGLSLEVAVHRALGGTVTPEAQSIYQE